MNEFERNKRKPKPWRHSSKFAPSYFPILTLDPLEAEVVLLKKLRVLSRILKTIMWELTQLYRDEELNGEEKQKLLVCYDYRLKHVVRYIRIVKTTLAREN